MNAAARKSFTRFAVSASVTAISAIVFFAPAASAAPIELCDMEMGPNGVQCVQETQQFEVCKLDKNLKCVPPPPPPKQFELCDLAMGPNGLQCVEEKIDDVKTPDEPKPPVDPEPDPEPEPEPEPKADPKPQVKPQINAADQPAADPAPTGETGVPNFEIAAGPAAQQPANPSYAGWIGSALVALGLLFMAARRRAQAREDAVSALEDM